MSTKDFLNADGSWKCIKCGACCHHVEYVYPDLDRGDGVCKNLNRDMTCGIYETRPPLCRVTKTMKKKLPVALAMACNTLLEILNEEGRTDRKITGSS